MISSASLYDAPRHVGFLDHRHAGMALALWPAGVAED